MKPVCKHYTLRITTDVDQMIQNMKTKCWFVASLKPEFSNVFIIRSRWCLVLQRMTKNMPEHLIHLSLRKLLFSRDAGWTSRTVFSSLDKISLWNLISSRYLISSTQSKYLDSHKSQYHQYSLPSNSCCSPVAQHHKQGDTQSGKSTTTETLHFNIHNHCRNTT